MAIKHDAVTELLATQIDSGIAKINEANEVLLAEDKGTPVRDIDKALKAEAENEESELPQDVLDAWKKAQEAYETYRANVETARNQYRTLVLNEDEVKESDVDKDAVKELRKTVMESLSFLKTYATAHGKTDLVKWAEEIAVPQVGRQGTSTVSGTKKPRVFVKVDGTVYDSFTQAAQKISTKEQKITAGELAEAWDEATNSAEGEFTFGDYTIGVTFKNKQSDAA